MELDKLAPAVVALQASLSPVDKSAENPFFKSRYAPLPEVRAALQPLLAKNKLALMTFPAIIEGSNGLKFYLIHESGQYIQGEWMLTPAQKTPQGEGADTTFKQRYGVMAITGLVADEDDDGNQASKPTAPTKKAAYKATVSKMGPTRLDLAKARLRNAIKSSGAKGEEYGWVANAKDEDAEKIEGIAAALELGKAVGE
jgi:hypothetical protein